MIIKHCFFVNIVVDYVDI